MIIVDDDPAFRLALRGAIEFLGHEVIEVEHGGKLVPVLRREQIDLILLDYHMPIWDGVETMVLLRAEGKFPPVIAYTARIPRENSPFESVMTSLGVIATVRISDSAQPLLNAVRGFFEKLPE